MPKKYSKDKKSGTELYRDKKQGKTIIEKPRKDIIYLKQALISFRKIIKRKF